MAQFDAKTVHKNDWGVLGGGAVVLIASLLPWFTYDVGSGYRGFSASGWDSGGLAVLGIVCAIAAAGIVAARVFGVDLPTVALGWRTIVLALAGVAAAFILLKFILGESRSIISLHRGVGLFLAVIGVGVEAAFAYMAFAASGERADIDRMRAERAAKAAAAPAAPGVGAMAPPPPAGYAPPTPSAPLAPPAPVAEAEMPQDHGPDDHGHDDHGHDGHGHEGHDHPHA